MSEQNKVYNINETATIADPGPLGLACFALTTFCLSLVNAGIVNAQAEMIVLMLALVYGGTVQIFAGMWEFKKNNVFGATAFSSYGSFWVAFALYVLGASSFGWFEANGAAVAMFLIGWTIFTAYMWIGTFALNNGLLVTFTLLLITFILLDIGHVSNPIFNKFGGYFGLATAFSAWYCSAAGILNTVYKRAVLPMGPRQ
ncbi:MAG: hypothetical protein FH756_14105 [Firmicutes bacterium]|nr:hypothetical protein [Bacillota bacterium]